MREPPETDQAWPWVRHFLEHHLPVNRGGRANTVDSYRTAFRRLREFLYERLGERKTRALQLQALEPNLLLDFLSWLQSPEGGRVATSTRNARLMALRSFFRFLELYCPQVERAHWERLRHLPRKKTARPTAHHLDLHELNHVFDQVDMGRPEGLRDLTLLAVLYNTGARASEVAGLRVSDLSFGQFPTVRLRGKGGHQRYNPIWPSTASLLQRYLADRDGAPGPLFLNQRRGALTRSGIARRVGHYLALAVPSMPSLRFKRLSTHSFRHTTAVHLLEGGADQNVIKAWLGHRSIRSTDTYLDLNLLNHRGLLERFQPPHRLVEPAECSPDAWLDTL